MMKAVKLSGILVLFAGVVWGSTTISFTDGGTFDQKGVGEQMTLSDGLYTFHLKTIDILGIEGHSALKDKAKHVTSVQASKNGGVFGVNSSGNTDAPSRFDHGEAWIAEFDTDIVLNSVSLASLNKDDEFFVTILDGSNNGEGDIVRLTNPKENEINKTLPAGTQIRFSAGVETPAVGFSSLLVTALSGGSAVPAVEPASTAGLPEDHSRFHLYLLIGQSNMAGRGPVEEQDRQGNPRVLTLTKENTWVEAKDPLHFDKPAVVGVGPGHSFGNAMAAADTNVVIGLIPCAVGGTGISRWQRGAAPTEPWGVLYDNAVARAKAAMRDGVLKGILWHQGEADCSPDNIAAYQSRIVQLVKDLRQDLQALDVPFVAGGLGVWEHANPLRGAFNENLASLPDWIPDSAVVSSEGLTHKGDSTHFNSESQRIFGRRYAEAVLKLQNAQ